MKGRGQGSGIRKSGRGEAELSQFKTFLLPFEPNAEAGSFLMVCGPWG